MTVTVDPSLRVVEAHLASPRFRAGEAGGRWRVLATDWPNVTIKVAAAPHEGSPDGFAIRFELSGYPDQAPTGTIWDVEADTPLAADKRPKGVRAAQLFRSDWESGLAMYAPFDRVGLRTHTEWASQYPMTMWTPTRDLVFVLTEIFETLNADDYLGA